MTKNTHAVALGRKGGRSKSEAKLQAAKENGKKGGRPFGHRFLPRLNDIYECAYCGLRISPNCGMSTHKNEPCPIKNGWYPD